MALSDSMMRANLDNVLGLNIFLGQAYEMEPAQFDAFLEQNPSFKESKRVQSIIRNNKRGSAWCAPRQVDIEKNIKYLALHP